jgi:hypothetical protein
MNAENYGLITGSTYGKHKNFFSEIAARKMAAIFFAFCFFYFSA